MGNSLQHGRISNGKVDVWGSMCYLAFDLEMAEKEFVNVSAIEGFLQGNNSFIPKRYSYSDIKEMTDRFKDKLGEAAMAVYLKETCAVVVLELLRCWGSLKLMDEILSTR